MIFSPSSEKYKNKSIIFVLTRGDSRQNDVRDRRSREVDLDKVFQL